MAGDPVQPMGSETQERITGVASLSKFGWFDSKLRMWRRELPVSKQNVPLVIYEDPNKATDAGDHFIWPSSLALANLLNRAPYTVFGHRILELGASHGLVSMTAAAHRAAEVFATDQEAVLPFLEANIARNPHVSVRAVALQWGTAISPSLQGEWGVILGSDLTFHKDSFLPLLHSLQTLASPHTRVILAHDDDSVPAGHRLRHEFFNETASAYFAVEEITCAADLDPNFVEDTIHLYELRPLVDAPPILVPAGNTRISLPPPRCRGTPSHAAQGATVADMIAHFSVQQIAEGRQRGADSGLRISSPCAGLEGTSIAGADSRVSLRGCTAVLSCGDMGERHGKAEENSGCASAVAGGSGAGSGAVAAPGDNEGADESDEDCTDDWLSERVMRGYAPMRGFDAEPLGAADRLVEEQPGWDAMMAGEWIDFGGQQSTRRVQLAVRPPELGDEVGSGGESDGSSADDGRRDEAMCVLDLSDLRARISRDLADKVSPATQAAVEAYTPGRKRCTPGKPQDLDELD